MRLLEIGGEIIRRVSGGEVSGGEVTGQVGRGSRLGRTAGGDLRQWHRELFSEAIVGAGLGD